MSTETGPGTDTGARRRILVADAPGGPHPSLYLPSLLRHFAVDVLWLEVEAPAAKARRVEALAAVTAQGGRLSSVTGPEQVAAALAEILGAGGVDGVVAFSERVVHMAQRAAYAAGLAANPPAALTALQDKSVQRAMLRAAGLPVPAVLELREEADVAAAMASARFPAVLKPAVGMGSLATFRVAHAARLPGLWEQARALAHADKRVGHLRPALLLEEELLGDPAFAHDALGDYLSVEALVAEGELHVLAVSDKLPLSPPFRENGHILPALRPPAEYEPAVEHVRQAHAALGIRFGATHTEVKLTAHGPRVIEVNGRVGGSVPEQLLLTAGYDLPLNLARISAGLPPQTGPVHRRWSAYLTAQPPGGRHRVLDGPSAEQLAAIPGVATVHQVVRPGESVDSADGTASNLLRVVAAADSPEELFALAAHFADPATFVLQPLEPTREETPVSPSPSRIRVFIGEPSSIDPCNGFEHDGALLLRFLADPLVDYDPATGRPHPAAAQSWTVSADGRAIDFTLRPGVLFHHGREVTAADYVYSLSRVARPATGSKLAYHLACVEGYEDVRSHRSQVLSGVVALDERTLRVTLVRPFHEVASVFGHRVTAAVPEELAEKDPGLFRTHPVSTGPYRILEPWVPGRGLTLERFAGYHGADEAFPDGGAGHLDLLEFRIYDELEEAYRHWHEGRLDVVKVPPARIPQALALGERFRRTPCALMQYIGFPTDVAPFDDPHVRRAVALAVDRQGVIDAEFSGTRPLAQRIVPPMLTGAGQADLTGVRYDPAAARALLEARGVSPVTTAFAYNAGLGHDRWVRTVVDQLNENLGWHIEPRPMQWTEFLRWLGGADTLFRMTWAIDYPSVDNFLYPLFHSASIGEDNFTRYRSAQVDELIQSARATAGEQERRALYQEAESVVCRELPLLPLWFGVQYHLVNLEDFDVDGPVVDMFGEPVLRSFRPKRPAARA